MDNNPGESSQRGIGTEPWRVWLRSVVGSHGGPSAVARLAEIPLQTLNNYLQNRTEKPNLAYLKRVSAACDSPMLWMDEEARQSNSGPGGLREDVVPYAGPPLLIPKKPEIGFGRWTVKTRALEVSGIMAGDIIEFEIGAEPREGEPVVAQLYDDVGGAETVLRIFVAPYLVTHTFDDTIDRKPIALDPDSDRVKVLGAFSRLIRLRNR